MKRAFRFFMILLVTLVFPLASCNNHVTYQDVNALKEDFIVSLKEQSDKYDDLILNNNTIFCLGHYNDGYILTLQVIYPIPEVYFDEFTIDGVDFKLMLYTYLFFYKDHTITEGLDNMYEDKLIDHDALVAVKTIFDSIEPDDYHRYLIRTDYFD